MQKQCSITLIGFIILILLTGCDNLKFWNHNNKYSGKVFKVRATLYENGVRKTETWDYARDLQMDIEDGSLSFYVFEKFVEIYPERPFLFEEISKTPTEEKEKYLKMLDEETQEEKKMQELINKIISK